MESSKVLQEEEEGIDLQKWFFLILNQWHLFLIFTFVALIIAFLYNKYSVRIFEQKTSILINQEPNPLEKANLLRLSLSNDPYRIDNEIGIIRSATLKKRTIKELDFFVEYYQERGFQKSEIYINTPFRIEYDVNFAQPINLEFEINYLSDSTVVITAQGEDIILYDFRTWESVRLIPKIEFQDTISIGDSVITSYCKFLFTNNSLAPQKGSRSFTYSFTFRSLQFLSRLYGNIVVGVVKGSSIITLSLKHSNTYKSTVYLNTLVDNYLLKGIERENIIAQRTIDFIDFQLNTIVDSLSNSEQRLEDFRSENKIVNIDFQAQRAYARQTDLERQRAKLIMEKRYLEHLKNGLQSNSVIIEELIAPSTLGITDAVLNNVVLELVDMYNEKTEMTLNTKRDNPYLISLDSKIESQKKKLGETIENILNATELSLDEIDSQTKKLAAELSKIPKDQQELLRFERKFQLNDELYTYLLTRRSEMQIKRASNIPSNEVLERAVTEEAVLVSPNKKMNYLIALFIGMFIPFSIVYIRNLLNNKIQSPDDIKSTTSVPVVGTIFQNEDLNLPVVAHSPTSIITESFRMLRANLQFVVGEDECPIIVVTSAMKGEGKSFTAINLAGVQSSNMKKVCLVDLDLRRPRLSEYLKLEKTVGMSNYLIGKVELDDIIVPVSNELFDLIPSGPIPPNPSELITSKRLEELITELRKRYDFVIFDSPPIGMVSDAMFLSKYVGYLLLVVRHNVTYKSLLADLLEEIERNQIKGINLVYNDVPVSRKGYYKYGYRYGHYYTSDRKDFWARFMKR